jgi:two-component SAPR family response regulator
MTGAPPLSGLSVLVLEDSFYIAEEARRLLENAGARVLGPCSDLSASLAVMERQRPDCAMVDINLGDGPEYGPARAILGAGVPVVLVTGYDPAGVPEDLKSLPCLQKPVVPHRLIAEVGAACRG